MREKQRRKRNGIGVSLFKELGAERTRTSGKKSKNVSERVGEGKRER